MGQRRRIIVRACIFLVMGAIINIAVAWGFSQRGLRGSGIMTGPSAASKEQWDARPESFLQPHVYSVASVSCAGLTAITVVGFDETESPPFEKDVLFSTGSNWSNRLYVSHISPLVVLEDCQEIRAGWPMRSLHAYHWNQWYPPNGGNPVREGLVRYDGWPARGPVWLPTDPLWPGFAINTIFYAAVVWMLFAIAGALRRRVRIRRGQCASCGYSLRGTPDIEKCSECGATA